MDLYKNMDKGVLVASDMKNVKYKILYWTIFALMLCYAAIAIVPVLWLMLSGFKSVEEMYAVPATFFPEEFSLSKLAEVWNTMNFTRYYANTVYLAAGAVLWVLLVSGLAGYVISKLKPIGTKVVFSIIFWVMMMPGSMRTVPLFMTFKEFPVFHFSLLNTFWPCWLMDCANAFDIILFKNFFDSVPTSLVESAKIDGANDFRIFRSIMIPLSAPVFIVVALFTFNGQLGTFFWPYITISDTAKTVIGVAIFKLKTSNFTIDYQMIALMFSILPQLIIFAIFQRYIIGGMNIGAVKG